jgi:hypothetical protein
MPYNHEDIRFPGVPDGMRISDGMRHIDIMDSERPMSGARARSRWPEGLEEFIWKHYLTNCDYSQVQIGKMFGVGQGTVSRASEVLRKERGVQKIDRRWTSTGCIAVNHREGPHRYES